MEYRNTLDRFWPDCSVEQPGQFKYLFPFGTLKLDREAYSIRNIFHAIF